jgi:hypothetical protein
LTRRKKTLKKTAEYGLHNSTSFPEAIPMTMHDIRGKKEVVIKFRYEKLKISDH